MSSWVDEINLNGVTYVPEEIPLFINGITDSITVSNMSDVADFVLENVVSNDVDSFSLCLGEHIIKNNEDLKNYIYALDTLSLIENIEGIVVDSPYTYSSDFDIDAEETVLVITVFSKEKADMYVSKCNKEIEPHLGTDLMTFQGIIQRAVYVDNPTRTSNCVARPLIHIHPNRQAISVYISYYNDEEETHKSITLKANRVKTDPNCIVM